MCVCVCVCVCLSICLRSLWLFESHQFFLHLDDGSWGRKRTRALSDIDFLLSPLCCSKAPGIFCVCLHSPFSSLTHSSLLYTVPFSFKVTFCALIPSPALSAHFQGASLDGAERRKDASVSSERASSRGSLAGIPAAGHWERQGHFSLPSGPRVGNLQDPAAGGSVTSESHSVTRKEWVENESTRRPC